jgi:uncharacterized protein (TIGR00730 family)
MSVNEDKKSHPARPVIKNIAFFGDSDVPKTDSVYKDAFQLAKLLAENGFTIVNGGGPGVMDASTKGAEVGKGETIAITFYPKEATGFEGRYVGNIVDKEIVTTNYIDRMFKLLEHADIYIIFKGGSGTMSEFATAWALAKLYHGHHKPFILYGSFWREIMESVKANMNITEDELDVFKIVERREDVLPAIRVFEKKMGEIDHNHCKVCVEKAFLK